MNANTETPSSLAELFVFELKKILPQDQLVKLDRFDLSELASVKNHETSYICARWAIDATSEDKHGEFRHLTAKLEEFFRTVKKTEWEAKFALLMSSMSIVRGVELAGIDEALGIIENVGKVKGFDQTGWDQLLEEIVNKSKA